ncbi:MAG: DUF4381 domain-containing protein [Pseudomonadota bacterium]
MQQASLQQLNDIVEPSAAVWWPPSWPVLLITAAGIIALAVVILLSWRRYRANRPQRIAIQQLAQLQRPAASDITLLCKRVALAYYPRAQIAELSGKRWLTFLAAKEKGYQQLLERSDELFYQPASADLIQSYQQLAMQWMRHARQQAQRGQSHV